MRHKWCLLLGWICAPLGCATSSVPLESEQPETPAVIGDRAAESAQQRTLEASPGMSTDEHPVFDSDRLGVDAERVRQEKEIAKTKKKVDVVPPPSSMPLLVPKVEAGRTETEQDPPQR